jgi:7-carboxy-7-deazaguanine synthase
MELFGPTIQGEGLMSGTLTNFLRTGGCGLKCSWCDSMFAVDAKRVKAEGTRLTTSEILSQIMSIPFAPYITLTGGDPCMHKGLGDLIIPLNARGIRIAVETQGQLFPEWLGKVDVITFSPKGPSSGNVVEPDKMINWIKKVFGWGRRPAQICIKIVVFDKHDLEYALAVYRSMDARLYDAFYFTAGTPMFGDEEDEMDEHDSGVRAAEKTLAVLESQKELAASLIDASMATRFNDKVHMGCQQHVLLWPDKHKGV